MTAKPAKTAAGSSLQPLQGTTIDASDPAALRKAVELAFDYRGDVTIRRKSDGRPIEGYIFDVSGQGQSGREAVRLIPKDSDERVSIPLADIESLSFSGKDTASGKTFENWIRKYAQKKLAGEAASIESDSLDSE